MFSYGNTPVHGTQSSDCEKWMKDVKFEKFHSTHSTCYPISTVRKCVINIIKKCVGNVIGKNKDISKSLTYIIFESVNMCE